MVVSLHSIGWISVNGDGATSEITMNPGLFCNLIGYIPLVGVISGVWRISENLDYGNGTGTFTKDEYCGLARGVCEILGLGILFLLLDLIMTLVLYVNHKRPFS